MLKNILISGLLCTFLGAESFDIFLQKAIKNSPYLESSALIIQQTKEQNNALLRYENPSLELQYSSFKPNVGSSDSGYSLGFSQPVRLWNISDTKQTLANANIQNSKANYAQKRAIFIRDISLSFTLYAKSEMLLELGNQEVQIAKKIYDISTARFDGGTISRGLMLQAKIDYEMTQSNKNFLSLDAMEMYFSLLKLAGITQEIKIENNYKFHIDSKKQNTGHPDIDVYNTAKSQSLAEVKLNSKSIESLNIFAELESEVDQDVLRVGVNFPLAIFNDKSEEKSIATLQATQIELLLKNEKNRLHIEQVKLQKQRQALEDLDKNNKKILSSQLELLSMYEDGYKIANINLLQLQDIKNKVIKTKRDLIQIDTALNQNAIYTNYTQGNYNE